MLLSAFAATSVQAAVRDRISAALGRTRLGRTGFGRRFVRALRAGTGGTSVEGTDTLMTGVSSDTGGTGDSSDEFGENPLSRHRAGPSVGPTAHAGDDVFITTINWGGNTDQAHLNSIVPQLLSTVANQKFVFVASQEIVELKFKPGDGNGNLAAFKAENTSAQASVRDRISAALGRTRLGRTGFGRRFVRALRAGTGGTSVLGPIGTRIRDTIASVLTPGRYTYLHSITSGGLNLCVFNRNDVVDLHATGHYIETDRRHSAGIHFPTSRGDLKDLGAQVVGTWGCKGAVAIKVTYMNGIRLKSFVAGNAHLPSGDTNHDDEVRKLHFQSINDFMMELTVDGQDHWPVFMGGDFNAAITMKEGIGRKAHSEGVHHEIATIKPMELGPEEDVIEKKFRGRDAMRTKFMSLGWHEGPVTWKPTYKFDENGRYLHSKEGSDKVFTPSWADRIIHKNMKIVNYKPLHWGGEKADDHRIWSQFDHRPVFASMNLPKV